MPKALPSSGIDTPLHHPWRRRSGFDELGAEQGLSRPTIARPILPIGLRMALLAGISVVYQAGPTLVTQAPNTWRPLHAIRCNRRRHVGLEKLSAAAGELRLRGIDSHD